MAVKDHVPFEEYAYGRPLESVGGRETSDAEQLAMSCYTRIRDHWPINKVPEHIVNECEALRVLGEEFKKKAEALLKNANAAARVKV